MSEGGSVNPESNAKTQGSLVHRSQGALIEVIGDLRSGAKFRYGQLNLFKLCNFRSHL